MKRAIIKKLQTIIDVLNYPGLLGTIGKDVDRGFARELFFLRTTLGISLNTIIDVGAAEGAYTKAARFVFPEATIHAFEAIPESLERLRVWVGRDSKLHLYPFALGAEEKPMTFYRNEFSFSSSLLPMLERHKEVFPFTRNEHVVTVNCKRLDRFTELVIEKPALLKIDVQGSELDVLRGAEKLLKDFDAVQLEVSFESFYQGQASYDDVLSYMKKMGFGSFVQVDPQYSKTKPPKLYYCDLVFLR